MRKVAIYYNYGARRIGKSKLAWDLYSKNYKNSILVVHRASLEYFKNNERPDGISYDELKENIITPKQFLLRVKRIKNIIFDDFEYLGSNHVLFNHACELASRIDLFTTPRYRRDKFLYTLIRQQKERFPYLPAKSIMKRIIPDMNEMDWEMIKNAWKDVVSNPFLKINKLEIPKDSQLYNNEFLEEMKRELTNEIFATDILGELYKTSIDDMKSENLII